MDLKSRILGLRQNFQHSTYTIFSAQSPSQNVKLSLLYLQSNPRLCNPHLISKFPPQSSRLPNLWTDLYSNTPILIIFHVVWNDIVSMISLLSNLFLQTRELSLAAFSHVLPLWRYACSLLLHKLYIFYTHIWWCINYCCKLTLNIKKTLKKWNYYNLQIFD